MSSQLRLPFGVLSDHIYPVPNCFGWTSQTSRKTFWRLCSETSNHLWSLAITSKTTAELPDHLGHRTFLPTKRFIWAHGTVSGSSRNFWTCVFFEVSFSARALLTNGFIAWRNWKGHGVMGEDKANAWKGFFSTCGTYVHRSYIQISCVELPVSK